MSRFTVPTFCNVTMLSCDRIEADVLKAWQISRPEIDPSTFNPKAIMSIDAPVNDLAGFLFHIRCPVILRELFATPRDHTMWARTSRLGDLTEPWPVHESLSALDISAVEDLYCQMQDMRREGARQDSYRKLLPLSFMTEFVTKMSLRAAVRMIKTLTSYADAPAVGEAATNVAHGMLLAISRQGIPIYDIVRAAPQPPTQTSLPSISGGAIPFAAKQGGYLYVRLFTSISLRAQIVRHRSLSFTDGLHGIMHDPKAWQKPALDVIGMEITASVEDWYRVVSKRNCWIAQSELWAPLLSLVNPHLEKLTPRYDDEIRMPPLPCADGACHFAGDAEERLKPGNKDPGLPCPRHANLTKASIDREKVPLMLQYIIQSDRPRGFWSHEVNRHFASPRD